jgi:23S rRNA (cytosine1962-C5)-methyltransferase
MEAAALNGVEKRCGIMQGDAFEQMQAMNAQGIKFDIVLADPPAFVKSRKDIGAGMKGYEKVARLAGGLVEEGGLLFVASCSHHATRERFNQAVLKGGRKADGEPKILRQTGAASDHPVHPKLPQSEYLKGLLLSL